MIMSVIKHVLFHIFETVMRDWALIGNNGGK